MVAALFVATFLMVLVVVSIVLLVFSEPIDTMLKRLLHPHISAALARYRRSIHDTLGIDRGVRMWDAEQDLRQAEASDRRNPVIPSIERVRMRADRRPVARRHGTTARPLRLRADHRGDRQA